MTRSEAREEGHHLRKGWEMIGGLGKNRSFLIYTIGNVVSLIGTWMQRILVGWIAWELTHSGAWLGTVAAADLLPTVLTAPFAGAAADRWSRLGVAKITQALSIVQALLLMVFYVLGWLGIEWLFVLTLANGTINAANQPARLALIHSLVGTEHLPSAVAVNSIAFNAARLLGPMAAGVAIVSIGIGWGFVLNALSSAFFLATLMAVQLKVPEKMERKHSFMAQALEGMRYTFTHRGIAGALFLMMVMGLCVRPLTELLPGYIDVVFNASAKGLVALSSALAIGAIAGGLSMAGFHNPTKLPMSVILGNIGLALAMFAFVLVPQLNWSLPLFCAVGFFMVRVGISTQVYVQLTTNEETRGRVLSNHGMIQRGAPALGALIIGSASDLVGFRWPVIIGCCLLLVCTCIVAGKRML